MKKKKKGFTLVELLVVIAIIALLMGILMPALARVRQIAYRLYCGTNLSGIGKAMMIYANDYDDEMPRAGGPSSTLGPTTAFAANTRRAAFGLGAAPDYAGGEASITAAFYTLIKYAEVTPKQYLCKGDSGVTGFKTSTYGVTGKDLIDLWDFGRPPDTTHPGPQLHCSYAYHMPYGIFALTSQSEAGMALAADPNPWQKSANTVPRTTFGDFVPPPDGDREEVKKGNAIPHQFEGQNVLFMDIHVKFEKSSACGINDDNIYTIWRNSDPASSDLDNRRIGAALVAGQQPQHKLDSFLITDGGAGPKTRLCFPADTPVWADGKLVPILEVVPGQKVGKLDSADGKPVPTIEMVPGQKAGKLYNDAAEIEWIQEHGVGSYDCYDVVFESGNSIVVVHSHDFLTVSGEWVAVEDLTSGSKLQSLNGPISITSVVKRPMPFVGNAYNLKIKGANLYFVGKDGVAAVDCSKLPGE